MSVILQGSGYDEEEKLDQDMLTKRLGSKDFWIKTLCMFYAYGFNEHKSDNFTNHSKIYFSMKMYGYQNCGYSN